MSITNESSEPAPSRAVFLRGLPFAHGQFAFRQQTRDDIDRRCAWPSYPSPFEPFSASLRDADRVARDKRFSDDTRDLTRLVVCVGHPDEPLVATFALMAIEWRERVVGNMGIRVHPTWCDRGIGTALLLAVVDYCERQHFRELRLDVAEANLRARRCYEKSGFDIFGSFDKNGAPYLWMRRVALRHRSA